MSALDGQPVIIGAGAAGLMAALSLDQPCIVLCAGTLQNGAASAWVQGGIAAAIGPDDSTVLHVADTLSAGAGLCERAAVERIVAEGPAMIEFLLGLGAAFDEHPDGSLALGLEAAHQRRRIIHAKDATGAEVMRVLIAAARGTPRITILEHTRATALLVQDNQLHGVQAGECILRTGSAIMATGGIGGLFAHTSNPLGATGSGLALAARAGAALRDMEFVQFHPTALACGLDPMPLISEALRGEGAVFVDELGRRFMQGDDLAARDIVARAVAAKYTEGGKVFLDARDVPPEKFPGIFGVCRAQNIDPRRQPIPVRPAAHYHMGGIAVDAQCESSVRGLFACGEAARTGLHGANRLASNSVLEALVTGRMAAQAIGGRSAAPKTVAPQAPRPLAEVRGIREICGTYLGISRNAEGLAEAIQFLAPRAKECDAALVALHIAQAALLRRQSCGAHFRSDPPVGREESKQFFFEKKNPKTFAPLSGVGTDMG
jgi:L-aspartate oxidase